ncbi:hypothetical protein DQ244_16235 [Blastococcus sp. TBT05-19]|uniref:hypothetical protein n=1 Tax=Blastococcus sp. TBT05-19 TaxID=2250581 RepID=UPI000DEA2C94|nr:hypothetical protein [Blastococcus sp. TBT05-19]RBY88102.1 hypothetical protein DQ244_16235 [Blastococcus sp. TBT05-19]
MVGIAPAGTTVDGVDGGRSLDYRALMTCAAPTPWLQSVEDQLASWLRQRKDWDVDVRTDGRLTSGVRSFAVRHHQDGQSRSLRARLVEPDPSRGAWTTELIAHERSGGGGWISLDVENANGNFVAVPALARYLMQVLPLADGELQFADEPQVVREHQLDEVMDLLCDEERHGLVFVAGTATDGIPFDRFIPAVKKWTREVYGLAQVIVLDPAATATLSRSFGEPHGVPPWALRTYLPGVDPAVRIDGRRHRIFGTASLAKLADGHVRQVLGRAARNHAAARPTPPSVQRVRRMFERLANQAIVEAIAEHQPPAAVLEERPPTAPPSSRAPQPAPAGDLAAAAERYLAEIELTRTILGIDALDEPTLRRVAASAAAARTNPEAIARAAQQIQDQQARIEQLEDRIDGLARSLEEEELEHAITNEALEKREDETRWLRGRLQEQGNYDAAFAPLPADSETAYPDSFADLLTAVEAMREQGLVFTGKPDHALALDDVDHLGKCVHTAWDALLALADYVRARRDGACDRGVDDYVKNTPSGYRQIPPAKFAATETAITMKQFGAERIFPVPASVDPSGKATMTAHVKLGRIGMVSPRLYYLDHYTESGTIVVGYIGRHLTNTQTN